MRVCTPKPFSLKPVMVTLVLAALWLGGAVPAMACEVAGKNKHIGRIVAIDTGSRTFVILDAETQREIRFTASRQTLASLTVHDAVQVAYEETPEGTLVSLEVVRI